MQHIQDSVQEKVLAQGRAMMDAAQSDKEQMAIFFGHMFAALNLAWEHRPSREPASQFSKRVCALVTEWAVTAEKDDKHGK